MKKLIVLLFVLIPALGSSQNGPDGALNRARALLQARHIARVEILRIPDDVLTRTAVTPETLRKSPSYSIVLKWGFEPALESLLANTSAVKSTKRSDLRWGLLLFDTSGNEVDELFVDHFGKAGYLNGQSVEFNTNMSHRFMQFIRELR